MHRWQVPLLGLSHFPAELTSFEIERFFTLSETQRVNVLARRSDRHRVALAVHIGFIRMTGRTLTATDGIPREVLRHIGAQLDVAVPDLATLRALYVREKTLGEHQRWAASALGVHALTDYRRRALVRYLRKQARETTTVDKLLQDARRWLFEARLLIPASRGLRALVLDAFTRVEAQLVDDVRKEVGEEALDAWAAALLSPRGDVTTLEWLQSPVGAGHKGYRQLAERIDYLVQLGVDRCRLSSLRPERQKYLAGRVRQRRPSRFRALREPRRVLEMACFLRVTLMQATDTMVPLFMQLAQELHSRATRQVGERRAGSAAEYRDILRTVRGLLQDESLDDRMVREQITAVLPYDSELLPSRAAAVRWRLSEQAISVRRVLRPLLELRLQAEKNSPLMDAVRLCRKLLGDKAKNLPAQTSASFATRWSEIIEGTDRRRALHGFEAAVLFEMRKALRNGSLWIGHSFSFRCRDEIMLPAREWESQRSRLTAQLGASSSPRPLIERLTANIDASLAALDEAVRAGELWVDKRGIHIPPVRAEVRPDTVERVARELFGAIGTVQLPELMVDIDRETHFSWALLGREPTTEAEIRAVYAGLLAQGTELSALGVSLMVPAVSEEGVGNAMRLLEEEPNLREANRRVLEFQQRHAVVQHWGSGTDASSDAMNLAASRHLWNARVDPKRRRHAVGVYTHVLDQWGIVYDQPVVVTQREAGVAIEGAIRAGAAPNLERLGVDTHGYTDFAMALAKLLGLDLCPRLKNLRDRRLHVPRGTFVPDSLVDAVDCDINLDQLEEGWDGLLRVAASVDTGQTSAVLALERFGSDSRHDPVHKAGRGLGQLLRTVYLCDYFSNADFRREVLRTLHHGESVHVLQRALHFGGVAVTRGRRHEELVAISGALTLLCNIVIAWMTRHMQSVLDQWRREKGRVVPPEVLRHIAPARSHGVNMRGTMEFPLAASRARLVPASLRR